MDLRREMAKRIIEKIKELVPDLDLLPCDRVNLDSDRFKEYKDSDEHPAQAQFETPPLIERVKLMEEIDENIPSILSYFLDGSRTTFRIADLISEGKYYPVIAGQVGVSVIKRSIGRELPSPIHKFCKTDNVIAIPDKIFGNRDDLLEFEERLNNSSLFSFKILTYKIKDDRDMVDLGVARIMKEMHDLEICMVENLVLENLLDNQHLLVIDGSLRFKGNFSIENFRNVVGLAKSFKPSFVVGRGRAKCDVGTLAAKLKFGQRTTVYNTSDENSVIGMWYLRIREPVWMSNPLQGIVKLEVYATTPDEISEGIDSSRVDTISAHVLRERSVTPYGTDTRWASHIYPIYLAEKFTKNSFMSSIHFQALF